MNPSRFVRAYPPAIPPEGRFLILPFAGGDLLTAVQDGRLRLLDSEDVAGWDIPEPLYLGLLGGVPCLAADLPSDLPLPTGVERIGLRGLYERISEEEYGLAGYASQMLYWRRTSRFCPVCGHATMAGHRDWGRTCSNCGHTAYPHVTPAVLILVHDADRILLASKSGWGDRYSILAGFVEPGETLEDCVRRETAEEVGLSLGELVYAGSQPWPFPHQLMVGFRARYAGGEIRLDEDELARAGWFEADRLPGLPPPASLSRRMIDAWADERHHRELSR